MAEDLKAEILIEAQDRASKIIKSVAGELGVFGNELTRLASLGGPVGLTLASIGSAIGAITLSGMKLADRAQDLEKLSKQTGVTAQNLQVMQQVIKETGGDSGSLGSALTYLNRQIATGNPLIEQLGLKGLNAGDAMLKLGEEIGVSTDAAKNAEVVARLLGRGQQDLIAILPALAAQFKTVGGAMEDMHGILHDDVLGSAKELDKQVNELKRDWGSMMTSIMAATLPTAKKVVEAFSEMWLAITGHGSEATKLKVALDTTQMALDDANKQLEEAKKGRFDTLAELAQGADPNEIFKNQIDTMHDITDPPSVDPHVEFLKARVAAFEVLIGQLKAKQKELAEASKPKGGKDVIGKTDLKPEELSDFDKQVKQLQDRMHIGADVATDYANRLQAVADIKFGQDVFKALDIGKLGPQPLVADWEAFNKKVVENARATGMVEAEMRNLMEAKQRALNVEEANKLLVSLGKLSQAEADYNTEIETTAIRYNIARDAAKELVDVTRGQQREMANLEGGRKLKTPTVDERSFTVLEKHLGRLVEVEEHAAMLPSEIADEMNTALAQMVDAAGVTQSAYDALFNGLQSGFSQVFANLITQGQTLKSAMETLWRSMVNAMLAELARLAAAKTLLFIIDLLGSGGTSGALQNGGVIQLGGIGGRSPIPPVPLTAGEMATAPPPEVFVEAPPPVVVPPPAVNVVAPRPPAPPAPPAGAFAGGVAFQRALVQAVAGAALTRGQVASIAMTAAGTAASQARARERAAAEAAQPKQETPQPITQNVTNVQVLGYDNHTIVQDLTSPDGKLRGANTRAAFIGAY